MNREPRTNLLGNNEIAVVGMTLDHLTESITQRVTEAEEYSNLKALFLATVSHELKTPLNIILGCVQLVEKMQATDLQSYISSIQKYNKIQKQNCFRLLRLINNMIDINKIEANSVEAHLVTGNIIHLLEDITLSVVEFTNMKNISIIFDTEIEEKIIAFDPDKLERVMLNLLSNAIKFTEPGGKIEVNIYDNGDMLLISVKDNGIGIPLEKHNAIFERFTQLDNSLTRKSEGSGIGLSLVKALLELQEAEIKVISKPGEGSEFIIQFPTWLKANESTPSDNKNMTLVERVNIEFSDIYL